MPSDVWVSAAVGPVAFQDGIVVNRKAVYRVLKQKGWFVHQRVSTPRPRVRGWVSRASRRNERWAMDVTHIPCGQDGWARISRR
jgi:putative transposase